MRVLVCGAGGFIGAHVAAALSAAGHDVVAGGRTGTGEDRIVCDFARDTDTADWLPRLGGIDAVVNCAGILREDGRGGFEAVHRDTPAALFAACEAVGIRKVVQISSLGHPEDTAFIRTKHQGDAALMITDLDWIVVRPSLVWSVSGSYGGNSLIRALAALPFLIPVVDGGGQCIQPITVEDLATAVVGLIENPQAGRLLLSATGPAPITFADFLGGLRQWLGFGSTALFSAPASLVAMFAWLADFLVRGPFGSTMFKMLMRDNVAEAGAYQRFCATSKTEPLDFRAALARRPAHVQDRWHARLYFLRIALRLSFAFVFLSSGYHHLIPWIIDQSAGIGPVPGLTVADITLKSVELAVGIAFLFAYRVRLFVVMMIGVLVMESLAVGFAMTQAETFFNPGSFATGLHFIWTFFAEFLTGNINFVVLLLVVYVLEDQR